MHPLFRLITLFAKDQFGDYNNKNKFKVPNTNNSVGTDPDLQKIPIPKIIRKSAQN